MEEGQAMQWLKEKEKKGQSIIYKTLYKILKIEQHEPTKRWGDSCSTSDTH